jgi:ABC-type antimicrobial peptide transport system permease subunit
MSRDEARRGARLALGRSVQRRTKEIGVRMALGAKPRAVLALVLRQGFVVTAIGIGVGLAGAVGLSQYLSTLLFGLTPLDPSPEKTTTMPSSTEESQIATTPCRLSRYR